MTAYSLLIAMALAAGFAAAEVTPGCFVTGYDYNARDVGEFAKDNQAQTGVESAEACQAQCAKTKDCGHFFYDTNSKKCFGVKGLPYVATLQPAGNEKIAGPAKCEATPPACSSTMLTPGDASDMEGTSWPFAAVNVSANMKSWSNGYQPTNGQCWPRDQDNKLFNCNKQIKVIEDGLHESWEGTCSGLASKSFSAEECEKKCRDDATCEGYQISNDGGCWHGVGRDCGEKNRPDNFVAKESKRFQRGNVRVLDTLSKVQIMGLQNMFTYEEMQKMTKSAVEACKHVCYSIIGCEYWQLNDKTGCWVERPSVGKIVKYPLTRSDDGMRDKSINAEADEFIAGEYIQRTCNFKPEIKKKESKGGLTWLHWAAIVMAALTLLALIGFLVKTCCMKGPKKRVPRSLKTRAVQPVENKPLLMTGQPVVYEMRAVPVTYQQPLPMYQQVVTQAAPAVNMFDMIDRNHDGVITQAEFMQAMGSRPASVVVPSAAPVTYVTSA